MNEFMEKLGIYSPLINLLIFFLGLYIGNKNTIGIDKRKEFNQYAEPILKHFDYMLSYFERSGFNPSFFLPESDIENLIRRLSKKKQKRFKTLIYKYQSTYYQLIHEARTDEKYTLLLKQIADIKNFLRLK